MTRTCKVEGGEVCVRSRSKNLKITAQLQVLARKVRAGNHSFSNNA